MELKELQEKVDEWIKSYGVRYFNELTNMTILTAVSYTHLTLPTT